MAQETNIDSKDIVIFRKLIKESSHSIEIYRFHTEYKFSPYQLADFILRNQAIGFIEYSLGIIKLTTSGIDFLYTQHEKIFFNRNLSWKEIPPDLIDNDNQPLEYYKPNEDLLDKIFLLNLLNREEQNTSTKG